MFFNLLFIVLFFVKSINALDDCSSPWEKVNQDICLLLNSNIKTWNHAQISCNYYGGDLLFIDNENEKTQIDEFLNSLLRYRFNLKPMAWLGAVKHSDEWIWSHNNKSVSYNNWVANSNSNGEFNCACLRFRDKSWRPCDCNTKQHFICRKSDRPRDRIVKMNPLTTTTAQTTTTTSTSPQLILKKQNMIEKDFNSDLNQEEKSIIVSQLVLMNDEDSQALRPNLIVNNDMNVLENLKKNSGFLRDPSLFVNIYRTKVLKNSVVFSLYECQYGFGYYAADNECTKYKICENWDSKYATLTLNKCVDGKIFSFKEFQCVSPQGLVCDPNAFVPVQN